MRIRLFLISWIALISFSTSAKELECGHVIPIQKKFLQKHLIHGQLNKNIEHRTVDQYIKHLDPSKLYLTQADIALIKDSMKDIFRKTSQNDCSAIIKAQNLVQQRVKENIDFSIKTLASNFKFDPKTKLVLDSDKRGSPAKKADAEVYQRKYIHLQIANYIATGVTEKEAIDKVSKNYDRALKKQKTEKDSVILAEYLDSFSTALDPHSTYWLPDAFEEFEIAIRLSLEGIGATLSSKDGFTVIEQLLPGGSASKSGKLQPKDMITAVAQEGAEFEDVMDQDLRDVVKKIRGPKGTKVRLSILRKEAGAPQKFQVELVRDKIKIEDEQATLTYLDRESNGKKIKVGVLNLPSFYADPRKGEKSSATDMKALLKEARQNKVDTLVLDLSGNGGGSLQDAVDIAGLFFGEGNVVKQSSRDPLNGEVVLADRDPAVDYAGPLVVLTSRLSASASEIVAGTLKDYKRAIVVGADHTYGKGTVQAVEDINQDLGAIKTTIGRYYIPGGHSTQHIGVISDITFPSALDTEEIGEKTMDYSLPPDKIPPFLTERAFVTRGPDQWKLVDKRTIDKLKLTSQKRIVSSAEFKKIRDNIAKNKKRSKGEVIVGEFLKDKEESSKEDKELEGKTYEETKVVKKEKYLKRADVVEAVNIAVDLAVLDGKGTILNVGAKEAGIQEESRVNRPQINN